MSDTPLPMLPFRTPRFQAAPRPEVVNVPTVAEAGGAQFITFGELFQAFWRGKLLVSALVTACVAAALAIAYSQTPVYQGKALIEVQGINENFLNRREIDPTIEGVGIEFGPYLQTQIKVLQTDGLLTRVADRLHLDTLAEFQPKAAPVSRLKRLLARHDGPPNPLAARQGLLSAMAKRLTVRLSGETRLIEVAFESQSPETAAMVPNTLAEEYVSHNLEKRLSATEHTAKWLATQLDELKANLDQAERKLQQFVIAHDLIYTNDSEKESVAQERFRQIQSALSTSREARIADQARMEAVSQAPPENVAGVVDSDTIRAYQAKLTDLKQKYAEARAVLTDKHYKVRQIQAEIDEVEAALARERKDLLSRVRSQYETSKRRENLIANDLDTQSGQVREQTAHAVEYNTLKRSAETYRKLYDTTLEQVKETELASANRANNVQIAENASIPIVPVRPSKPLYAATGMFAGLILGAIATLHRDRRNRLVRVPGAISVRLGVPEFGPIPSAAIDLPYSVRERSLVPARTRSYRSQEVAEEGEPDLVRAWLDTVTWRQRESMLAESYRGALASLMHSTGAEPPRVIVITSACAGEGKTTVVANLAIALAESGRRILLIDADRRRPHLHHVFKSSNEWGFSDFLLEDTPVEPLDFARITQATEVPNLRILPAGSDRSCVPNLVDNHRAALLLAAAREEFDTILIDTAPMLALSDARGLGRMADGVALVIRAEETPEHIVLAASERLQQDCIHVLGTILNNWKPTRDYDRTYYERAAYGTRPTETGRR